MHNFKQANMLRLFAVLFLLLIFALLYPLARNWQMNILLSALLILATAVGVYGFVMIKGLVIGLGLFYFVSIVAFFVHKEEFFSFVNAWPASVILAAYIGINLYKYLYDFFQRFSLMNKAVTDASTGFFTQRYFELKLQDSFGKAFNKGKNLSVVIIGVDTGIKEVAGVIKKQSRSSDFIARHEKEGFCALLSGNKEKQALLYSEKLKKAIENSIKVKVHFGIAAFPDTGVKSWQELMHCAQLALYKAKEGSEIHVYRNH